MEFSKQSMRLHLHVRMCVYCVQLLTEFQDNLEAAQQQLIPV